jgi:hypothetical protein
MSGNRAWPATSTVDRALGNLRHGDQPGRVQPALAASLSGKRLTVEVSVPSHLLAPASAGIAGTTTRSSRPAVTSERP